MASLNKCFFIGNLTRDPEMRNLPNGEAVANVSIACNEVYKTKDGEKKESVEFVNLTFYRRLAEIVAEYCKNGASIHVEGKMKTRKWQDAEGKDRYTTAIIVNEMQMLSSKPEGGNSAPAQDKPATTFKPSTGQGFDNFDDDHIPF